MGSQTRAGCNILGQKGQLLRCGHTRSHKFMRVLANAPPPPGERGLSLPTINLSGGGGGGGRLSEHGLFYLQKSSCVNNHVMHLFCLCEETLNLQLSLGVVNYNAITRVKEVSFCEDLKNMIFLRKSAWFVRS